MSQKIFISYAPQDRDFAKSLKSRMIEILPMSNKESFQISDIESINVGESIRQTIKNAVKSADTVVIVSTENSDSSSWVNYEVGLADAMGKNLVIVGKKGAVKTSLMHRLSDTARVVRIENG